MTGDDYRWDQMSVMERCEVLRARLDRVDNPRSFNRGDQLEHVCPVELARLRRVEEAARALRDGTAGGLQWRFYGAGMAPIVAELEAALDSEPER